MLPAIFTIGAIYLQRAARWREVSAFAAIVAVLYGVALLGPLGVVIAVPLVATAEVVVREYSALRRQLSEMSAPGG